jgi:hypothetical protein
MTYSTPEVNILGEACVVIQGSKTVKPDGSNPIPGPDLFENED